MMRVVFPLVGDSLGGAQRSTLELAGALSLHREIDVQVVLHRDNQRMRRLLSAVGIEPSFLPSWNFLGPPRFRFRSRLWAGVDVLRVTRWCRSHEIDIVHTNDWRCHRVWGEGASRGGMKWVLHRRKVGNPPLGDRVLGRADRVIAISEVCRNSISRVAPDRLCRVYNAVAAPADFQRSCPIFTGKKVRLLFLGNVTAQKRFDMYVQIASRLCDRDSERYEFHFAGRDSSRLAEASLKQLPQKVRRRFVVHGEVPDPWPLLGETDILIAPAVNEAFGRTLVEAQLAGVLVIASRDGGHPEIVKHLETGFLVTLDDVDDFVRWVDFVCNRGRQIEIEDVCSKALQTARKQFGIDRLAVEIVKIYRQTLGE